jgi:hypothetical protein
MMQLSPRDQNALVVCISMPTRRQANTRMSPRSQRVQAHCVPTWSPTACLAVAVFAQQAVGWMLLELVSQQIALLVIKTDNKDSWAEDTLHKKRHDGGIRKCHSEPDRVIDD